MSYNASDISAIIKKQIKDFDQTIIEDSEIGQVLTVGDGIALVSGLNKVKLGEILDFGNNIFGMALNLETNAVGVVLFGDADLVFEGMMVKRTYKLISVPVGDALCGRVINALGEPIDGKGEINTTKKRDIFQIAFGVMARQSVDQPLETGIMAIDALIPIGQGQRELIIGDRQTGKTAIAIDAIINQRGKNVKCIYVAIGQKNSSVAQIVDKLKKHHAFEYTTVVIASASEFAPMQYIAPYAGISIAEEWMLNGQNVLIVYDDLSKHAVAYRTLSLLLRRPPGREAYPGDIFYLHSQLLERSARITKEFGGGSITALPIVETQYGDISAYIPTNVISITDGQIFTSESLFNSGQRPAIDVGFSVSRVGSAAQIKAMKQVVSSLKLELAQYNEMLSFAQFSSDLDENTKKILNHGKKIYQMLKQEQYAPISQEKQIILIYSIKNHLIDLIPDDLIIKFKKDFLKHLDKDINGIELIKEIGLKKDLNANLDEKIGNFIKEFINNFLKINAIEIKEDKTNNEIGN